jgi:hypothetical protein
MTSVFRFPRAVATTAALVLAGSFHPAEAHISYSGRNLGTWSGSNVTGSNGTLADGAVTILGQAVSSSFGWADATDVNWGDSHRMRAYRFTLSSPATVTITAERQNLTIGNGTSEQTGAHDLLLPAFSLYAGLSHLSSPLAHDSSTRSVEWLRDQFGTDGTGLGGSGKKGSFNALGGWSIGNSLTNWPDMPAEPRTDSLRSFTYVGHAADGTSANYGTFATATILGDGLADGIVTGIFPDLPAGDYSIFVGGANYAAQDLETPTFGSGGNRYPTYGVSLTLSAVPEPMGLALAVAGLGGAACLAARRRRGG